MTAAEMEKEFHPHCYEHLTEMVRSNDGLPKAVVAYICSQLDCDVHYNTSIGYFNAAEEEDQVGNGTAPSIRCPKDCSPMYLAEIHPEHSSYRLWKCPECDKSLTNLDSSQAAANT